MLPGLGVIRARTLTEMSLGYWPLVSWLCSSRHEDSHRLKGGNLVLPLQGAWVQLLVHAVWYHQKNRIVW